MRFLVVGAGVIGSLYAGRLALAGHEVGLVARGRRLAELREGGLRLLDEVSGRASAAPVRVVEEGDPEAPYDAVFAALRRDQVEAALPALARLRAAKAFVTMTNGAGIAKIAGGALGEGRLLLGFPGAGGARREDGSIAYRVVSGLVQRTTLGEASGGVSPRVRAIVAALRGAGFPSAASADMTSWQRSHLALVCPMANAIYLKAGREGDQGAAGGRAALASLAADRRALGAMVDSVREGFGLVRASGGRIEPPKLALAFALPRGLLARAFGGALRGEWGETVVARHALAARAEMRLLNEELLALAAESGHAMPVFRELAAYA